MLLAIDIGNTNVVAGIYDTDRLIDSCRTVSNLDMAVDQANSCFDDLLERQNLAPHQINKIVVGSVVPVLTSVM